MGKALRASKAAMQRVRCCARVKRQAAGKVAGLHGKATNQYHIEGDFIRSSILLLVELLFL